MPAVMRARERLANVLAWPPMRWDAAGGRGGQGGERLFLLWDASLLRWLISPGACYWDAHWVRCVPGSPFPRALFTPPFPAAARRSHLPCALPSAQRPHPV